MFPPYPLRFHPILFPKVWGGDRLARLGKGVSPGERVGESWELADLPATSASGAGGGAARSVVANGALAGKTLGEAWGIWGPALLEAAEGGGFPLLVKFLDARENLSVQVHPSAAYARAHAGAHPKTECWYVLDAAPGAVIYAGVRRGIAREELARRLGGGDEHAVVDALVAVPAVVGEMHLLPSGTLHALGAGVMVAEVQTPSDTTFRAFDWGRSGREMHVREALECAECGPAPPPARLPPGATHGVLVTTEFFSVAEVRLAAGAAVGVGRAMPGGACGVVVLIAGAGAVEAGGGEFEPVAVEAGATVLVPAAIVGGARLRAAAEVRALVVHPGAREGPRAKP